MSSGTQIELDWTGVDAGQGGAAAPARSPINVSTTSAGPYLTDEEILGITPVGVDAKIGNPGVELGEKPESVGSRHAVPLQAAESSAVPSMPAWMQTLAGDPKHGAEAQQLWQEHQAFRAAFSSPDEARAIKELFPGGAQEAQTLKQSAQSVDRIDAAIFSGDTRAQSEVVAELAAANPAAFRSLFAEAAKVLSGMASGDGTVARLLGGGEAASAPAKDPGSKDPGYSNSPSQQVAATQAPTFDPVAYSNFERSTNDAVARDVRTTISETLTRVLPEGVAEGAARRIGEDIFNEVHRALAADRALSEQVGEALRGHRFGNIEQQRVASMLAGRAKQIVPSVARRVIGEWTSSVLGTARTKAARQAAAASRVDIAAAGGSLDSMPLRAMSPREVDYASMSDDEILGM